MKTFDFVAIDFETANKYYGSACSIGIAAVKNSEIVKTFYSLINPLSDFSQENIEIHGITEQDVKEQPTFEELWPRISHFFGSYPIIAHNAQFDMSVLKKSLCYSGALDFKYIDTMSICRDIVPGTKSLSNCAQWFKIDLGNHHNALDDAISCAKIAIACMEHYKAENFGQLCFGLENVKIHQFSELLPMNQTFFRKKRGNNLVHSTVKPCDIKQTVTDVNPNNPLYGKSIVFTGELSIDRSDAMQLAVNVGAIIKTAVSKKTDYLVVGTQDLTLVGTSGRSSKERKAEELNNSGTVCIKIITEEQFLSLLNG